MNKWVPSEEKLLGMKSTKRIQVVSGIVVLNKHVLLTQRDPGRSDFGMLWETPGGKVEPQDKTLVDALAREFMEELGVDCEAGHIVGTFDFDPPVCRVPVRVHIYQARIAGPGSGPAEPVPHEAVGLGWFTLDQARALPLAPANRALFDLPGVEDLFA
jgi:8-oxo-dGTP diphosphatase